MHLTIWMMHGVDDEEIREACWMDDLAAAQTLYRRDRAFFSQEELDGGFKRHLMTEAVRHGAERIVRWLVDSCGDAKFLTYSEEPNSEEPASAPLTRCNTQLRSVH